MRLKFVGLTVLLALVSYGQLLYLFVPYYPSAGYQSRL